MAATRGLSLGDAVDLAFAGWDPGRGAVQRGTFGATRTRDFAVAHPMDRMFRTRLGTSALSVVGNESRTLAALERLSVEIAATALHTMRSVGRMDRILVTGGVDGRPPVVLLLSPQIENVSQTRIVSDEFQFPRSLLAKLLPQIADPEGESAESQVLRELLGAGPGALADLFAITAPEIVLTRRPRMIPLCVPSPHMKVHVGNRVSTAGVLCRDAGGVIGITACLHGTGPAGTLVRVGTQQCTVKDSNQVQDIVFIPLRDSIGAPKMVGRGGVRTAPEPARADVVRFDGATNPNTSTRVFGADYGLLRARPTVMLKVQTDPDTDEGDSGSALVDEQDQVLGFAFERTGYNDYPQFTDWIWAANALRALDLSTF